MVYPPTYRQTDLPSILTPAACLPAILPICQSANADINTSINDVNHQPAHQPTKTNMGTGPLNSILLRGEYIPLDHEDDDTANGKNKSNDLVGQATINSNHSNSNNINRSGREYMYQRSGTSGSRVWQCN